MPTFLLQTLDLKLTLSHTIEKQNKYYREEKHVKENRSNQFKSARK